MSNAAVVADAFFFESFLNFGYKLKPPQLPGANHGKSKYRFDQLHHDVEDDTVVDLQQVIDLYG